MLKAKKILFILLTLSLVFAIASCGGGGDKPCESCVDADNDGICDVCDKEMPEEEVADVPLFEDEEPTFQVVLGKDISSDLRQVAVSSIKSALRQDYDINIDLFYEESENDEEIDIEILIGDVSSRGDKYFLDGHTLGKNGYVIKIVGSKILINAGSDEMLAFAIETFAEEILLQGDLTEVIMTKDDVVIEIQDNYRVSALKVNGNDMKGYTIATLLTNKTYKAAALTLQDFIYSETGYWFDLVDIELATDKSIIMKHVDGITGEESFKVSASGSQLLIECGFDNMFEKANAQFTTNKITSAKGELDFKGTVYTQDISTVYYEDFGAKGDGKTDDFFAIYNTHVFANECGQTVKASRNPEGKVYYIYDTRTDKNDMRSTVAIPVRTNTDWQGVKFIIDDRKIPTFTYDRLAVGEENLTEDDKIDHEIHYFMGKKDIFEILPNAGHEKFIFRDQPVLEQIVEDGLRPGTTNIDFHVEGWDGDLMIVPYNSEHGVFRRRGAYASLQSAGAPMRELIVIDKDGNVSEETPIMFEYTNLDYITVYKVDKATGITVGNAEIETWEARVQNKRFDDKGNNLFSTAYIYRGINVRRSYTVVENVKHEVIYGYSLQERASGLESSNYNGMFTADEADHVTFRNCEIHGRMKYDGHSSYDIKADFVNKIVFENCHQPNFWVKVDSRTGETVELFHDEYESGVYTSMSTVKVEDNEGKLQDVSMCWGVGGTNYCKNMEFINSSLSRFDAHAGLYNGKVINSSVNYLALTGYGDMIIDGSTWYQPTAKETLLSLRGDYGYLWNGNISVKDTSAYVFDIEQDVTSFNVVGHGYVNFYYGYPTSFPNVTLDNLQVYSMRDQELVDSNFSIYLVNIKDDAKKMHLLGDSGKNAIFTYIDANGDGYLDEPLYDNNYDGVIDDLDRAADLDGNGVPGETSLLYGEDFDTLAPWDKKEKNKGITHPTCKNNLNPIKPPEYIKIINNNAGYKFHIVDTSVHGVSDGGWYRDAGTPDTMGGFFGGTKFMFGTGADDYFYGTAAANRKENSTFVFD